MIIVIQSCVFRATSEPNVMICAQQNMFCGVDWRNRLHVGNWDRGLRRSIPIRDTVCQRTRDIAISEACVCLQGSHTRSVFLDFFFSNFVFS